MKSGIYAIENRLTKRRYIGSSANLSRRKGEHFKRLRAGSHQCRHLMAAYLLHGSDLFEWMVLEICEKNQLLEAEQRAIDAQIKEHGRKSLYNSSTLAHRVEWSEESRALGRAAKLGALNPFYGKTHSDEVKKCFSEKRKGRVAWNRGKSASEEWKAKIAASGIGRKQSEETKEKRKQTLRRLVADGVLFNAQHRANMSVAQQKRRGKEN